MKSDNIVLDSYSMIAYLEGEPGSNKVVQIFEQAKKKEGNIFFSLINWGEVYYSIFRAKGEPAAEESLLLMEQLPVEIVTPDRELVYQAARLKSQHAVAYADCIAAALAKRHHCCVLTGDKEFHKLSKEIEVTWL